MAVTQHLGEAELSYRKILRVDDVTQDERGLRTLIHAGCYRTAVNLTGRLLTIYGQGYGRSGQPAKHSPHSLQLWFTRLALLAKLGEFELLNAEAEPFGQLTSPDVFYDFYPEMYNGKSGSIACFSFRLLLAELPIYLGKPHVALDRLSELHVTTREIKEHYLSLHNKAAEEFWQRRCERVLHSIINCGLMVRSRKLNCSLNECNIAHLILADEEIQYDRRHNGGNAFKALQPEQGGSAILVLRLGPHLSANW